MKPLGAVVCALPHGWPALKIACELAWLQRDEGVFGDRSQADRGQDITDAPDELLTRSWD